jgi:hypothetical protein
MTMRLAPAVLAGFVLFTAAPCGAQQQSLIGTWEIVEAQPAPWTEESQRANLTATGKRLIKQTITFTAKEAKSKHKPLACRRPLYEPTDYEADAMFQGNLPEPNPTAAAVRLGFKKGAVPGVDVKCVNGAFSYHFRDRNTVLTALNNVIYTLNRQ